MSEIWISFSSARALSMICLTSPILEEQHWHGHQFTCLILGRKTGDQTVIFFVEDLSVSLFYKSSFERCWWLGHFCFNGTDPVKSDRTFRERERGGHARKGPGWIWTNVSLHGTRTSEPQGAIRGLLLGTMTGLLLGAMAGQSLGTMGVLGIETGDILWERRGKMGISWQLCWRTRRCCELRREERERERVGEATKKRQCSPRDKSITIYYSAGSVNKMQLNVSCWACTLQAEHITAVII